MLYEVFTWPVGEAAAIVGQAASRIEQFEKGELALFACLAQPTPQIVGRPAGMSVRLFATQASPSGKTRAGS